MSSNIVKVLVGHYTYILEFLSASLSYLILSGCLEGSVQAYQLPPASFIRIADMGYHIDTKTEVYTLCLASSRLWCDFATSSLHMPRTSSRLGETRIPTSTVLFFYLA